MKTAAARGPAQARRLKVELIEDVTLKLFAYCHAENWAGYDPYDALNSKLLSALPIFGAKWPRLALTQVLKRSPVNLRPLLQIPKTQNPKALALLLSAVIKLGRLSLVDPTVFVGELASLIEAARALNSYWCWGYSFAWQGRSIVVPRGQPNLVCTTFVAEALLDLFEESGDSRYLEMAESAANYLMNELLWTDGRAVFSFGYPTASSRSRVHNANLLAAAFLCRVYRHTSEERMRDIAMEVAVYAVSCQRSDGSWPYGELRNQQWIDNFHTGYNLCALRRIAEHGETSEFDKNLDRGYEFYRHHFFRSDGVPKYFHNRTYPVDVHSAAQSIITLLEFSDHDPLAKGLASDVLTWALDNLRDPSGYFYYQKTRSGTIKTSYMRWSQAWMLLALAVFLESEKSETNGAY